MIRWRTGQERRDESEFDHGIGWGGKDDKKQDIDFNPVAKHRDFASNLLTFPFKNNL